MCVINIFGDNNMEDKIGVVSRRLHPFVMSFFEDLVDQQILSEIEAQIILWSFPIMENIPQDVITRISEKWYRNFNEREKLIEKFFSQIDCSSPDGTRYAIAFALISLTAEKERFPEEREDLMLYYGTMLIEMLSEVRKK